MLHSVTGQKRKSPSGSPLLLPPRPQKRSAHHGGISLPNLAAVPRSRNADMPAATSHLTQPGSTTVRSGDAGEQNTTAGWMMVCKSCGARQSSSSGGDLTMDICMSCGSVNSLRPSHKPQPTRGAQPPAAPRPVASKAEAEAARAAAARRKERRDIEVRKIVKEVERYARGLDLGETRGIVEQTQFLFNAVLDKMIEQNQHWLLGNKGLLVATACLYIATRQAGRPVTLIQFASRLEMSVFAFGKIYKKILELLPIKIKDIDPVVLLENFGHTFYSAISDSEMLLGRVSGASSHSELIERMLDFFKTTQPKKVAELASKLMAICGEGSIASGVNLRAVAWAAFILALESLMIAKGSELKSLRAGERKFLITLCASLDYTSGRTITQRVRDFVNLLIKHSKKVPWLKGLSVNFKDITSVAIDIIQFSISLSPHLGMAMSPCHPFDLDWLGVMEPGSAQCEVQVAVSGPCMSQAVAAEDGIERSAKDNSAEYTAGQLEQLRKDLEPPSFTRNEEIRSRRKELLDALLGEDDAITTNAATTTITGDGQASTASHSDDGSSLPQTPPATTSPFDHTPAPRPQHADSAGAQATTTATDGVTALEENLLRSLLKNDFDKNAMTSQPIHTLQDHLASTERQKKLETMNLDSPRLSVQDMSELELEMYLCLALDSINSENLTFTV